MKKSNIFLILFFALLPALVLFYYKLMAITYLQGDGKPMPLVRVITGDDKMVSKPLKPFNYLVIDGIFKIRDKSTGAMTDNASRYQLPMLISGGEFSLQVHEYYQQHVKYRQSNDTLYISMQSDFSMNSFSTVNAAVWVTAPTIKGMSLATGKYTLFNFAGFDTMTLRASGSDVKLAAFTLAGLQLDMDDHSVLSLPGGQDGPALTTYSLKRGSTLTIPEGYVDRLKPGYLDSTAMIIVTGSAISIAGVLQDASQKR